MVAISNVPTQRLLSLDILRGLTIALMILVNTPGSWSHVYAPFLHSEWHGCTLTDLVFPSFVFIVGVSLYFSLSRFGWAGEPTLDGRARAVGPALAKIARRTASIFIVGLLLNYFPFYDHALGELRIYGVLQRIALAYGFAATLCVLVPPRRWLAVVAALGLGYWALLYFGGGADPYSLEDNLKRSVDLATIGADHMYGGFGIPFDPEGLIGLFGTAVNVLLGAYVGRLIRLTPNHHTRVKSILLFGVGLLAVGLTWDLLLPINKPLWTSSYAVYTSGIAACALAVLIEFVDHRGHRRWATPFVHFGKNPLVVYALSGLLVKTALRIKWATYGGDETNVYAWLYRDLFSAAIPVPKLASLLFAIFIVTICWSVAYLLYRRRIFVKL